MTWSLKASKTLNYYFQSWVHHLFMKSTAAFQESHWPLLMHSEFHRICILDHLQSNIYYQAQINATEYWKEEGDLNFIGLTGISNLGYCNLWEYQTYQNKWWRNDIHDKWFLNDLIIYDKWLNLNNKNDLGKTNF